MDEQELAAIVYLARKLHWSRHEIGCLTPAQFNALLEELQFQELQEQYRHDFSVAAILAAIYNTIPTKSRRIYKPRDFIGVAPKRKSQEESIEKLARVKGIKFPTRKLEKEE